MSLCRLSRIRLCAGLIGALSLAACPLARADDADDQYAVAAGHYTRKQWAFAAREFHAYLHDYPHHVKRNQAMFFLAETLLQMGRFDEAGTHFRRCLEDSGDPNLARSALFRAGESDYLAANFASAKRHLRQFLTDYPQDKLNAYVLTYLGNIALSENELPAAEESFRDCLGRFPHGPLQDDSRFGLARVLHERDNREEAERLYLALAAKTGRPLADDAQFYLGSLEYAAGRYQEAITTFEAFESAFSTSPWLPTARLARGWALLKLNRPTEASSLFRQVAADPTVGVQARYWLGLTQESQEDWTSAAETFLEAAGIDPSHELIPALRFHAGDALLRGGDVAAAGEQFDQVIAAAPADNEWIDDAMWGRMATSLRQHDYPTIDRLAEEFSKQFAGSPRSNDVQRIVARALIERKRYPEAEQVLERLMADATDREQGADRPRSARCPLVAEDRYLLSLVYQDSQRYEDALAMLLPVLDSADGQLKADAQLTQASLLVAMHRFNEAISPLEAFLAAGPSGEPAVKAKAQLAVCYARTARLDKAKDLAAELLGQHGQHELVVPAAEQLAEAAYDAGDSTWSAELFKWLANHGRVPQDDSSSRGLSGLAWSQLKAGRPKEAAATFLNLLEKHPQDELAAEAALVRGQILHDLGHTDQALEMFDLVIERFASSSKYADALWSAARLRDELGRDKEATALYDLVLKRCSEFPQCDAALYQAAWALNDSGDLDGANERFALLHREYPQSSYWVDATFRLAERAFKAGDYSHAGELAGVALASRRAGALRENLLYLSGQIAAANQRWDEARVAFETTIADYPESSLKLMADFGIAETIFRQGDYAAAGERLDRLYRETRGQREPWLAIVHLRLAQALAEQQNWTGALAIASPFEGNYPQFAQQYEVDFILGRCLADRADFAAARQAYQKVIRSPAAAKTETAAKAQLMIAESYFHQKNYEEALRNYLRLEILYDFPDLQAAAVLQAGTCHQRLGQETEAAELYRRIVDNYPQTESATEAARRLQAARERIPSRPTL